MNYVLPHSPITQSLCGMTITESDLMNWNLNFARNRGNECDMIWWLNSMQDGMKLPFKKSKSNSLKMHFQSLSLGPVFRPLFKLIDFLLLMDLWMQTCLCSSSYLALFIRSFYYFSIQHMWMFHSLFKHQWKQLSRMKNVHLNILKSQTLTGFTVPSTMSYACVLLLIKNIVKCEFIT